MLNLEYITALPEVVYGLTYHDELAKDVQSGRVIILKARNAPVAVGQTVLVKVNTSLGVPSAQHVDSERKKLDSIVAAGYRPDCVMDLTNVRLGNDQFYQHVLEVFGGPVGTLPHYLAFRSDRGIDRNEFLETMTAQAESGISFMTLHLTPTQELCELAERVRSVPTTSRGGALIIEDMRINRRSQSLIAECFDEVLSVFLKNKVALSIGTVFRPACLSEALDEAHVQETVRQKEFVDEARRRGVPVQIEGIGHIALGQIQEFVRLISGHQAPVMTLGPLPTDAAVGQDHVASAIGAAYAAMNGATHMLNSITREEHTGGVPSEESVLEGLMAARIAAHCVNVSKFPTVGLLDRSVGDMRKEQRSCVVSTGLFSRGPGAYSEQGCSRCGPQCPLRIWNDKAAFSSR
ncbi:MAG: phosphomethylpyrimidine synthase ThiC [Armatimonadota bacterium]